ncbi:MAG TPA: DUF3164 family protein [Chitinophagales bacterium]|nr:DUF3164 family protein [Chitinophagales bacterium]
MTNQTKEQTWKDEAGIPVPGVRITKSEKLREAAAYKLAKGALKLNSDLTSFKDEMRKQCEAVVDCVRREAQMQDKAAKETKGNFTWYNFDRSIRVECSINEQIEFDDTLLALCKEKLDEFLHRTMGGSENAELVSNLVKDAFSNTRGRLDAKKVMSLLKYETKIESSLYKEAMDFLKRSIRRPGSKTYYRVSVKNAEGGYDTINLNISSI